MFRRSTFVRNTEVEDSDSQETQCDELRQLVDAQLRAELMGERRRTVWTLTTECSDAEVPELDDHRMSAHEAKVSVEQQQEVVRVTHSEAI